MALPIFIGEKMAKHILSCSFGKDRIATALLALQHGEPLDELVYCEVMFSEEISGELPEHNRFIHETAIPYFEQRGIPTRVLRSEKTYLSCFYHVVTRGKTKGMLSGFPLSGRCTIQRDCKLPPIKAYQKALPPDTVQYIGIAADEPKRLARLKPGQISLLDKYHVAEPEARSMCELRSCCPHCMTSLNAGVVGFARTRQSANCGISTDTTPNSGSFCLNYRTCRINPPNVLVGGELFVR